MHVVYGMFLMFKHLLCWKYQYNQYMFDFINIYSFISVSGCVGMAPSALFCTGSNNAVKTALKTVSDITCQGQRSNSQTLLLHPTTIRS